MSSFIEKIKKTPQWAVLSLSTLLILGLTYLGFILSINQFEKTSHESLSYFDNAYKENIELIKKRPSDSLNKEQIDILLRKVSIIEQNKLHHLDLVKKLYKNNYALLTLFPFISAITAIIAFLLIQKGWTSSGVYLKSFFILFTTLTALIGIYPEVYKQTESIEANLEAYLSHKKIQKSIFNYALTAPVIEKKEISFNVFLDSINTKEKALSNIIFGLQKKTVSKQIFEAAKE
ncbi:hypothetical protein [Pontimicrobium sp. MEBiC01747]